MKSNKEFWTGKVGMIKVPPNGVAAYMTKWLAEVPFTNNLSRIHYPELIEEQLELKEQKNGNFKETVKTTQE